MCSARSDPPDAGLPGRLRPGGARPARGRCGRRASRGTSASTVPGQGEGPGRAALPALEERGGDREPRGRSSASR